MIITVKKFDYTEEIEISDKAAIALSIAIMAQKGKISEDTETHMAFDELDRALTRATDIPRDTFTNLVHHYTDVFTIK